MGNLAAAVDRCDLVVKFGTDGCGVKQYSVEGLPKKIDAQLLIDVR